MTFLNCENRVDLPARDRHQLVHEHPPSHVVVEDTGLGITRTRNGVVIRIMTRPRKREAKESFYKLLCRKLHAACSLAPSDAIVSIAPFESGAQVALSAGRKFGRHLQK